ncbi:hypothetical protein [Glycomyces sp. NPDC021274]|uniref:hypothetical protein n=1 Tax=Glycomyces sp. NPDC021274 TaxID=3155120 RepID=UPI0033C63077
MSGPIVAQTADEPNFEPPTDPQSFTIRCAECADELGAHLPHCPGVLAAGYDTAGYGAFSGTVFPEPGGTFGKHQSAFSALRFYSRWGPVELHLQDGRVIGFDELD